MREGLGAKDMCDAGDLHSVTSSATDVCLDLQQLAAVEYGQGGSGLKFGGIIAAWCFCWCYSPPALPSSVAGCWLSDMYGLAGLGDGSGDPRP